MVIAIGLMECVDIVCFVRFSVLDFFSGGVFDGDFIPDARPMGGEAVLESRSQVEGFRTLF